MTSLWSCILDYRTLEKSNTSQHSLLQQVLLSSLIVLGLLVYPGLSGLSPALLGTPRGGPFPESGYSVLQVRRAASKDSDSVTCKSICRHELRMQRWIKGPNSCKTPALINASSEMWARFHLNQAREQDSRHDSWLLGQDMTLSY